MRRGETAANRPGKTMNRAQPGIRERQSAEQAGQHHVFAGTFVLSVENNFPQRTRRAVETFDAKPVRDRIGAQADVRFDELRERVQAGLARLPDQQREVLELAYYGGFTQSELAGRLGRPLGTIKSQMFAGLRSLRELIEQAAKEEAWKTS